MRKGGVPVSDKREKVKDLIERLSSKYPFFQNLSNAFKRLESDDRVIDFLRLVIETLDSKYDELNKNFELLKAKLSEIEEARTTKEESAIVEAKGEGKEELSGGEISEEKIRELMEADVDELSDEELRALVRRLRDALREALRAYEEKSNELRDLQEKTSMYKAAFDRFNQLATAYQQLKEDYDSYRARIQRNLQKLEREVKERVLSKFITILDNFDYALKATDNIDNPNALKDILEGIKMIKTQIEDLLAEEGLEIIDAKGEKFDPKYHEVFEVVENPDLPDETVVEQIRKGYKLMDKVIRPALVKVSKRPKGRGGENTQS